MARQICTDVTPARPSAAHPRTGMHSLSMHSSSLGSFFARKVDMLAKVEFQRSSILLATARIGLKVQCITNFANHSIRHYVNALGSVLLIDVDTNKFKLIQPI